MAKILLVEDDSNLREIYGARLEAEGYTIVAASDGEEALASAVRERPDLIISDVMMPKISGFDMLDILRTTPETKNVKVIVMTALSQEEDRRRGEELGADRYVVKSQVTLDDVVGMVRELLAETSALATPQPTLPIQDPTAPAVSVSQQQVASDGSASLVATTPTLVTQEPPSVPVAPQSPPTPPVSTQTSLNNEVEQFVATSPLMNGAGPELPTAQPPSETPQQQS